MSNSIGKLFVITCFGESHGKCIGVVVDGCPAGLEISVEDIQKEVDKRRPGESDAFTSRAEENRVEILSGILDGYTTGAPVAMMILNEDVDDSDYEKIFGRGWDRFVFVQSGHRPDNDRETQER